MYEMAAELGIPERWVELRHEITHGQIPELRALEECAREGIEWLWEVFWGRLDTVHSHGDAAQKRQEMSELFKSFFKEKKIDIRRGQSTNMSLITRTTKMILQLAKNEEDMQTVADILVEEKLILPNQKS
jgi:ribosomal biogenesis protein LAS1